MLSAISRVYFSHGGVFLRIVTGFMMTWGYCVVMTDELMRVLF